MTTRTRMTDDEKRARREAKKQSNLTILGRATFKATGAVLFGIEDRNDKQPVIMHMTLIAGKVTGCHNATTGEECDGRHWSGHCCHETRVLAYEAQRQSELAAAEQVAPLVLGEFASDLSAHVVDDLAALPVVVRMLEGKNVYVLTPDDRYECVQARDLDYFYPQHREATDAEVMYLNSADGPMRQGRQVVRQSYREMYAGDYNDVA